MRIWRRFAPLHRTRRTPAVKVYEYRHHKRPCIAFCTSREEPRAKNDDYAASKLTHCSIVGRNHEWINGERNRDDAD
jgi:hypothetical protein